MKLNVSEIFKRIVNIILCLGILQAPIFSMHHSKPLHINIKLLKGTHTVLSDMNYAPFWGLSLIENGIARQWYELCPEIQNKPLISLINGAAQDLLLDKEQLLKILSDQKNTSVQDLVLQMFHMAGGTFTLTNAPNNPVRQFNPWTIGKILRMVHDAKAYDDAFVTSLSTYLATLQFKDSKGKNFVAKHFRPFAKALATSLKDVEEKIYSANTVQSLLLGYMLAKSHTKADLEQYFSGFEGRPVQLPDEMYSDEDFTQIINNPHFDPLASIPNFADFVCAQIYQEKYRSVLPKITSNVRILYTDYSLTDCVESTMLNLTNFVTYDQNKKLLGVKLPQAVTLSPALHAFYQVPLNSNPAEVENLKVHEAWAGLVEKVMGAAYNRLGIAGSKENLEVRNLCDGVIPVETIQEGLPVKEITIAGKTYQVYEIQVDQEKYWLVPEGSGLVCFELMPTVSNIIVIMNHLFDLKLFSSIQDIFKPDFVQEQFAALCQKFSWHVSDQDFAKITKDKNIEISVSAEGNASFKIHLMHKAHGYVSMENKMTSTRNFNRVNFADYQVFSTCLSLNLAHHTGVLKIDGYQEGIYWYDPVLNIDSRHTMIQGYFLALSRLNNRISQTQKLNLESYIAELIISMGNVSDMYYHNYDLKDKNISPTIAQALFVMAQIVNIKNNDPKIIINYANFFLKQNVLTKEQVGLLIDTCLDNSKPKYYKAIEYLDYKIYEHFDNNQIWKWIEKFIQHPDPDKIIEGHILTNIDLLFKVMQYCIEHNENMFDKLFRELVFHKLRILNSQQMDQVLSFLEHCIHISSQEAYITLFEETYPGFTYPILRNIVKSADIMNLDQVKKLLHIIEKHDRLSAAQKDKLQQQLLKHIPEGQGTKQSMVDFAKHGRGAIHGTDPRLMAYNPAYAAAASATAAQASAPSYEQLQLQRTQLMQFRAWYEQQQAERQAAQLQDAAVSAGLSMAQTPTAPTILPTTALAEPQGIPTGKSILQKLPKRIR